MPAMTAKSTLFLLLAGAAACAGDQDPMAPEAGTVTESPAPASCSPPPAPAAPTSTGWRPTGPASSA